MKTSTKGVATDWKEKAFSAVCEFSNGHIGEDHLGEEIRAFAETNGVARLKDARVLGTCVEKG